MKPETGSPCLCLDGLGSCCSGAVGGRSAAESVMTSYLLALQTLSQIESLMHTEAAC